MEKAVLKTLIYADIFDYPLKINEIHKWLIEKKVKPRQIEKTLKKLVQNVKCQAQKDYYFLPKKAGIIDKRLRRAKQSAVYLQEAQILSQFFKIIPWIKLVGISGGLAMGNTGKKDDIDLFIITSKNRLWISRLFILGLLSAVGKRRKRQDSGRKIAGKFCVNILLEEDRLEQVSKDLFTAHEVLQMKVLWQRQGIYSKYLSDNKWVFKFLPNWISITEVKTCDAYSAHFSRGALFLYIENLAKWLQLKIMQQPQGAERITDGAVYFHPRDCRKEVLRQYQKRLTRLLTRVS